jgi:hypothetical protein
MLYEGEREWKPSGRQYGGFLGGIVNVFFSCFADMAKRLPAWAAKSRLPGVSSPSPI